MRDRLTERLVRAAGAPGDRPSRFIWDTEVSGFGLCVTRAGAKAFVVRYRIDGRERRLTIGSHPDWSVTAARYTHLFDHPLREATEKVGEVVDLGGRQPATRRMAVSRAAAMPPAKSARGARASS